MLGGALGDRASPTPGGVLPSPEAFVAPALVFPLPGGRGIALPAWAPVSADGPLTPAASPDGDSSAERRRRFARRLSGRGGLGAVRRNLDPHSATETLLEGDPGEGPSL
jgi:hypothetical protein